MCFENFIFAILFFQSKLSRFRLHSLPVLWGRLLHLSGLIYILLLLLSCFSSVQPHRWQPTRLLCPWDSPGKNTGEGCHFLLQCMKVKNESEVTQSCPTLSDPMDWSLPGSSVHGIFQARVLKWVAIATAGHTHRGNQNWKRHVYPNVHHSTVYNSQDMEAT